MVSTRIIMSVCMATAKPQISILMAVYEPRMDWLREQLLSLNAQTYPNVKLYIRDDCSPTVSFEAIQSCVQDCIRAFSYEIDRNEENLGSNGTFERLTAEADGEYFAYCDQDDVWLPEKLERLQEVLERQSGTMVYCDMEVIDGSGALLAQSLRQLRPRLRYVQGDGLAEAYFFRNCTAGCSMLIRAEAAKRAMPFPKKTVCDQWLAVIAANMGTIGFLECGLVKYRQHGSNQTGILRSVVDKKSYREERLLPLEERLEAYRRYGEPGAGLAEFIRARIEGDVLGIWRNRAFSPVEALFEIVIRFMPERLIKRCIKIIQR